MLTLPVNDTSGFKAIPQLRSWKTMHVTLNVSQLRVSCYSERLLRPTRTSIEKHNAGLAVSQIPIELLCYIFQKFLEDDLEFPDYTPAMGPLVSLHTRADPTILGQVCSWWRRVALSTPALWANICILEPKRAQISRTRLWLERATTHPLDIVIEDRRKVGYNLASLDEIISALASRRQLWRKVNFSIPNGALQKLMLAITDDAPDFPNLESASLCIGYRRLSQKTIIDAIWKAFHSSPVLHDVDWRDAYYHKLPTHAPWTQFTHLNLQSDFNVQSLIDILVSCPKIRVLSIFRLSLPSEATKSLEPIVFDSIHTLILEAEIPSGPLFEALTLPSLRSLDISHRYLDEGFSEDLVAFREFLKRSDCSLDNFILYDQNFEEARFMPI